MIGMNVAIWMFGVVIEPFFLVILFDILLFYYMMAPLLFLLCYQYSSIPFIWNLLKWKKIHIAMKLVGLFFIAGVLLWLVIDNRPYPLLWMILWIIFGIYVLCFEPHPSHISDPYKTYDESFCSVPTMCVVCTTAIVERTERCVKLKKCDHFFHMDCIGAWFGLHDTCPICHLNYSIPIY